jgi:bisanhydrobacterioruberin hydratase
MNARRLLWIAGIGLYLLFLLGGMASYTLADGPPAHMRWAGTAFLFLTAALVLARSAPRARLGLVAVGFAGYGFEVLGVWTGFPFGGYAYTEVFAPLLFGVPLVMTAAWVVLTAYTFTLAGTLGLRLPLAILVATVWLTAVDLVLDPVAAGPMGLWVWEHPGAYYGIPVSNYLGWLLVSLVAQTLHAATLVDRSYNRPVAALGFGLVLFFTTIALGQGLFGAAAFGATLLALHALAVRRAAPTPKETPVS